MFLHVGQCGNQIAVPLWEVIHQSTTGSSKSTYFDTDGIARCLLVDTEPKVIRTALAGMNSYAPDAIIGDQSGRGNNWALGYCGGRSIQDPTTTVVDAVFESFRHQVESCDNFLGCTLVHSLAGGTGAGFGCRLAEVLRDDYPSTYLTSISIFPSAVGDTPLQHYNTTLSISWLQEFMDSILYFDNDDLMKLFTRPSARTTSDNNNDPPNVSMATLNRSIATAVASLVLPINGRPYDFIDSINSVTPMTNLKFCEVSCYPPMNGVFGSKPNVGEPDWLSMTSKLLNMIPKGRFSTVAAQLTVRSNDVNQSFPPHYKIIKEKVTRHLNCVSWNPFPLDIRLSVEHYGKKQNRSQPTITLLSNRTRIATRLAADLDCALAKFHARAYVHWYERYGCDDSMFESAFRSVSNIINDYKAAV